MSRSCNGGGVGGVGSWPIRGGGGRRVAGSAHWSRERLLRHRCGGVAACGDVPCAAVEALADPVVPSRADGIIDDVGAAGFGLDALWWPQTLPGCAMSRSAASDRRCVPLCGGFAAVRGRAGGSEGSRIGRGRLYGRLLRFAAVRAPGRRQTGCCLPPYGLAEMRGGSVSGLAPQRVSHLAGGALHRRCVRPGRSGDCGGGVCA